MNNIKIIATVHAQYVIGAKSIYVARFRTDTYFTPTFYHHLYARNISVDHVDDDKAIALSLKFGSLSDFCFDHVDVYLWSRTEKTEVFINLLNGEDFIKWLEEKQFDQYDQANKFDKIHKHMSIANEHMPLFLNLLKEYSGLDFDF